MKSRRPPWLATVVLAVTAVAAVAALPLFVAANEPDDRRSRAIDFTSPQFVEAWSRLSDAERGHFDQPCPDGAECPIPVEDTIARPYPAGDDEPGHVAGADGAPTPSPIGGPAAAP
jgi:hypothetical protein